MALSDFLITTVKEKGWLSLASIYFDNSHTINIFTSRGYIAYSQATECFYEYGTMDTTDSAIVESRFVHMYSSNNIDTQRTIVVLGVEHMQHFDLAQYSHYRYYTDDQEKTPYPKIPTPAQLNQYTYDEKTGMFTGGKSDTAVLQNYKEASVIPLYDDFKDVINYYTGADIKKWKEFYKNQEKFKALLAEAYGVMDCI